ncbi:M20/M25/M40 family metallo-hydrolase [Flaviaesturariibacter aridisoli]|uniref:Carboxypeptidase Q n=1 Tax=Flaviaesturariibacter aridisoli TaxID=2545761 RepID=A0A4R4E5L9_9BACT|nr:M20/M25/M40 family metallo-hydrolase [Flaviaesturariibacter aridisoli]TCZ74944.1 M20/M25/M40 family metallo-hydrolase [Flaviaesturariibacter aridisoli]
MKRALALLAGLLLATLSEAQNPDSVFLRRLADEILVNSGAYENLRQLTKSVGGRLAGSPAMARAERWGQGALEAAGAERVWLQECLVPHWVRGGKDRFEIRLSGAKGRKTRTLQALALGNSPGSKGPLTAPVLVVRDFAELDAKKDSVKGKIVFFNYKFNPRFVHTFEAYSDAGIYRGQGPVRAAKYGAVGVAIRSLSGGTDNFPHTGTTASGDTIRTVPSVALGLRDADLLDSLLRGGQPVVATLQTFGRFLPDTIGHNVIGELRGTEAPDEIITIGGHLDSWDPAEGAHDDGAGIVHTIEVLRAFRALGYRPKHSIRFVLFANEENGLRGGRKYAEEAKAKGERHIFALESDEGGFTPRGFGLTASDEQFARFRSWAPLLAPYGASELRRGGGGSDIGPLGRQGTPTCGFIPDSQRYFDVHHASNDVFENVNKRELELGAVTIAALIYLVDKYGL